MNKEYWKEMLPVIEAYTNGKEIEYIGVDNTIGPDNNPQFGHPTLRYRIKEPKTINIKEVAAKLHGKQYRDEISPELLNICKDNRIVVVFGASDDLMEFRGAIYDELDVYNGGTAYLTSKGLVENNCEDCENPCSKETLSEFAQIEAVWGEEDYSWIYKTKIPHEVFDIMENRKTYCRGIVFHLDHIS